MPVEAINEDLAVTDHAYFDGVFGWQLLVRRHELQTLNFVLA